MIQLVASESLRCHSGKVVPRIVDKKQGWRFSFSPNWNPRNKFFNRVFFIQKLESQISSISFRLQTFFRRLETKLIYLFPDPWDFWPEKIGSEHFRRLRKKPQTELFRFSICHNYEKRSKRWQLSNFWFVPQRLRARKIKEEVDICGDKLNQKNVTRKKVD